MSRRPNFQRLLEPYNIGQVKTRNRIVKTSSGMSFQTDDYMNEKSKAYCESLARGGVGLLIVESPAIDYPISLMFPKQFRLDDDRYIKGYSELAEFLVKRGRRITVINSGTADELGEELAPEKRFRLLDWFSAKGVKIMNGVKYEEVTDRGLVVTTNEGKRQTVAADTIVLALPLVPNNTRVLRYLEGKIPEIHVVGDGHQPGLILDAIADGSRIAYHI
jgi:hypothetical protein